MKNKIQHILYKFPEANQSLYEFKTKIPLRIICENFNYVLKQNKFSNVHVNNLIIEDESKLFKSKFKHKPKDIWFELTWNALTLNLYNKKLKLFYPLKIEFEKEILLGNFSSALKILDEIEVIFGKSLWLIKNRLNLKQEIEGLEFQKEYAKELKEKDIEINAKILIYLFSVSSEKHISYTYFNRLIDNFFEGFSDTEMLEYIKFKLQKDLPLNIEFLDHILMQESSSSLIDLYETLIELLQNILLIMIKDNDQNEHKKILIKVIRKLYTNTDDERFINILRLFNQNIKPSNNENNFDIINIYNFYYKEDYETVKNLSEKKLNLNPQFLSLYPIYVKSLVLSSKDNKLSEEQSLFSKILYSYLNILSVNDKTNDSIQTLLKISITYSNLSFIHEIIGFIHENIKDNKSYKEKINHINNITYSPYKINIFPEEQKRNFINNLKSKYLKTISLEIDFLLLENNIVEYKEFLRKNNINNHTVNLYTIDFYEKEQEFGRSLELSKKYINSNIFIRNFIIEKIINNYINLEELEKAYCFLVDAYLENNHSETFLPIWKVVNLVIQKINKIKVWDTSIELPLLFYLATVNRDSEFTSRTEFAYENYLVSRSCKRPLDLINLIKKEHQNNFDAKIVYFLKEVCIPDIMKKSIFFQGFNEIEKERINICHELTLIDEKNSKEYLSEIRRREQNLFIKNEISRLEKNKIYVNINAIKKEYRKEFIEDYNRFKLFIQTYDFNDVKEIKNLINRLDNLKESENLTKLELLNNLYLPDTPESEVDDLFRKIIESARDIFVKHEHHGLDVYLSTKIRHGTISNHLRKPLEHEKLITLKNKQNDQYHNNEYWGSKFLYKLLDSDINMIQRNLQEFSKNHDEMISFLNQKILQISTYQIKTDIEGKVLEESKTQLFKYHISDMLLKDMLFKVIEEDMSFNEFVDFLIKTFWEQTDINLRKVRDYLKNTFEKDILENFYNLQKKIESFGQESNELKNAIIRTSTEMRSSIENLITWFARMEVHDRGDYDIKSALDIVVNTFGQLGQYIIVDSQIECKFKGKTLENFVDIFYILIDNAFKHSGFKDYSNSKITIKINKVDKNIIIETTNLVSTKDEIDFLNESIDYIKDMYGKKQSNQQIYKEGGTGFYKIEKILSKDLQILNHELDFNYVQNNGSIQFNIKLNINGENILA